MIEVKKDNDVVEVNVIFKVLYVNEVKLLCEVIDVIEVSEVGEVSEVSDVHQLSEHKKVS